MPPKNLPSPAADILADRSSLGVRLRALRRSRAMTLKELSALTGVALSTLSKMELGQVSISYAKFAAVARALEVDIAQLFGPLTPAAPAAGSGADSPAPAPTALRCTLAEAPGYLTGAYDYKLLAGQYPRRSMTPMYGRILARDPAEFDDYMRHAGQEFLVVLDGEIEIRFEDGKALQLAKHDTAYFDSGVGHIYLSRSAAPAEIMVVMTSDPAPASSRS